MLPKRHPLANVDEITTDQLNGLDLTILSHKLSQPLAKTILQFIDQHQIKFKTIYEANGIAESIEAVDSGQSCAILPSYMQALATEKVVVKALNHALPCLDVFMSFNKISSNETTEQFLEEIRLVFDLDQFPLYAS